MDENPYESPKELGGQPTVKAGVALGALLMLSIPAGCICGGITCYASGVVGEMTVERHGGPIDAGFVVGIPIGLIVTVLIPLLVVGYFRREKKIGP